MTDQLSLYNGALLQLGERDLSALTDENENRRSLDRAWDGGNIRLHWLEEGLWNFAVRTRKLEYESALSPPDFGYQYVFVKDSDWVRTAMICSDEYFQVPITKYEDENSYLVCDLESIYVSYISSDASFGLDYSKWTQKFIRFCELDLAERIMHRATGLDQGAKDRIMADRKQALREAKSMDAMDEPARFPPYGSWTRSRNIGLSSTGDYRARWR